LSEKERKKFLAKTQEHMTEEEFQEFQKFRKEGNKHLETNGCEDCIPWTTDFLTFLNMIQVFGDCVKRTDYSKPFRVVIDYDPEQVRVAIHRYSTDKLVSQSFQQEVEE